MASGLSVICPEQVAGELAMERRLRIAPGGIPFITNNSAGELQQRSSPGHPREGMSSKLAWNGYGESDQGRTRNILLLLSIPLVVVIVIQPVVAPLGTTTRI